MKFQPMVILPNSKYKTIAYILIVIVAILLPISWAECDLTTNKKMISPLLVQHEYHLKTTKPHGKRKQNITI